LSYLYPLAGVEAPSQASGESDLATRSTGDRIGYKRQGC